MTSERPQSRPAPPTHPFAPRRSTPLKIMQILAAMVWAAVLAASVGRFKLAAKPGLRVILKTEPAPVHIVIDNQKYGDKNGRYTLTPITIDLPPGKHRLKIARDGYIAHIVSVEGDSAEVIKMDEVVLERTPGVMLGTIQIGVKGEQPEMFIEIDDGFLVGPTPFAASDLSLETPHTLSVFPAWPDRTQEHRCRFKIQNQKITDSLLLDISLKGGKLVVSNCQKVKLPAAEK